MFWLILLALIAITIGALAPFTTIDIGRRDRKPGEPLFMFSLTVIWPSGPITYAWPKRK